MELTIKISLSPEEAKGQFKAAEIEGAMPSLQPVISLEGAPSNEIFGLQAAVPSPEASLIEPTTALEAPRPSEAMIVGTPSEEMPPEISFSAGELLPYPTMVSETGQEPTSPDFIPEISSEKQRK